MSSFLDLKKLANYIENAPRKEFYAGPQLFSGLIEYAQGSGYFLSKDLVEAVFRHSSDWDHNLIDDVALGMVLNQLMGIKVQNINRVDNLSLGNDLSLGSHDDFHFRCKSESAEETVAIMHNLQIRINGTDVKKPKKFFL